MKNEFDVSSRTGWTRTAVVSRRRLRSFAAAVVASTLGLFGISGASRADTFSDTDFAAETVATTSPFSLVGMAWAPDGRLFVWQKNGAVRIIKNGVLLSTPFVNLAPRVNTSDDRGLWGLAFHPDFANNGYVYLSYTYEDTGDPTDTGPKTSRLTRVTANPANPDVALPNSEVVVLGSIGTPPCSQFPLNADCIPADGGSHTIGSVMFGPDGKMYLGIGDGADVVNADPAALRTQNLGSWSGKILRMNPDGTAPGDNPFDDGTNSIRSKVWLYGVRNPFRFHFHPTTGEIYFGDVGWNTWEEVNRGQRGKNYGWPCYEGNGGQPQYMAQFSQCASLPPSQVVPPLFTYQHNDLGTAAIGGPFYTSNIYPTLYQNNLFFADYSGNWIRRMTFNADGTVAGVQVFADNVQAPVTVELGPDGMLYYLSFTTGQIRRIRYNGLTAVASATPANGYTPLSVNFSSAGSRAPSGGSLSYLWNFGDGTANSTAANPSHTYTGTGVIHRTATLTVSSGALQSSTTVGITLNSTPPTPTISVPATGTEVKPGQTIDYLGSATDPEDGGIAPANLTWTILLHHNTHIHTFVSGTGTQGSFVTENHGPIGTYSYEVMLTATDSSGLQASTSVFLPVIADTLAPTDPTNLVATSASSTQINLSWGSSTDDVSVSNYLVERCQGAGCSNFIEIGAPVTNSYVDSTLVGATTYSYRVRAADATANHSGYTNVASATTANPPPVTGLMAAWAFNEGAGNIVGDASGNGNTGTITGATWTAGKYGNALNFNGVDNLVVVPSSATLNVSSAMTLEAWVYPNVAQNGWRTIMQRETDAWFLNASNSNGALFPSGGGTLGGSTRYISASSGMTVGQWTHVALTFDGFVVRLYVAGVLVNSGNFTGLIETNGNPLRIGGNVPYGEFFNGRLDELRVYNRALAQSEIQTDMNTSIGSVPSDTTPPTAPSGLSASPNSTTQINLTWTASTDDVGVAGYRIERCQGAGCSNFAQVGTPVGTTYSDLGLTFGTSYSYRVRGVDLAGNLSTYSNIATAVTPTPSDTTPPTAPGGLSANATSSTQISLSWTAATDNVGVTGYRVERCQGTGCSSFAQIATPTGLSMNDTGLVAGNSYSYRVRAADAVGNLGPYSNTATATTQAAPPVTGLVAAYAFNEGTGTTAADASGNSNTGTLQGGPTWTASGKYGGALTFDGTNDLVLVNSSTSLNLSNAMTLEAWIFPTATQNGWRTIVQRETDAYFLNASNSNGPLFPSGGGTFGGSSRYISGSASSPVSAWTHVALTYDGTTLRLYVNGTQAATGATTGAIETNGNPLRIGGNVPYGEFFLGRIDEVRVYNRALTQTEITNDMNTSIAPLAPDTTPPSAPSALGATAPIATRVDLSWTAATDDVAVTGYRVERCQGSGCSTFAEIATPTTTTYSDTTVTAGNAYSYRVRANDAAGNLGGYSNTASATTPSPDTTPPTAPTGLGANATSATQISLSWTAATDNVGVTGYRVERCSGVSCSSFAQIATPTGTTFGDTGLTGSTSYSYRVRAIDAAGNLGPYSATASATTPAAPDTTAPTAPSGLGATAVSPTQINLSWTASTDNVGVTSYLVERCAGASCANFVQVAAPTTTTYGDTGLAGSTLYRYRVRATDAAGNFSGYSAIAQATTQTGADTTPPTAPTGLTATVVSGTRIDLSWTAATDNVGVTGYRVERCSPAGCSNFAQIATPTTTTFSNTGLTNGTSYSYRVRAVDAATNLGPYSTIVTAQTTDTTAPTAPSGLVATPVSGTQINLTWTASTDNVGVANYRLERCQGSGCTTWAEIATPTSNSFNNTGLSSFTTYRYRVRATDAAGNFSAYSSIVTSTTLDGTAPTAPATLTATPAGSTQINLSWAAATDNVAVTGYRVESCSGTGCSNFAQIATPTTTTFNNTGLTGGTSYSYRVRATDAAGNLGPYSPVATAATPVPGDTTPPTAPSGLTANALSSGTQVDLSWTASTDNVGVAGYRVERCTGAACTTFAQIATPTATTFSDTGLAVGTTYRYQVRAADAAGNLSAYSGIANATTPVPPDTTAPTAPSALGATAAGSTQINLSWTASTDNVGVTGYRVERCSGVGCSTFAQIATPATASFNDTGLTASTSYSYRVRAADAAGNLSGYSNVASATTQATNPPPGGLVAAYGFNENLGTVTADASGNANTGTLIAGTAWVPVGKFGSALSFDGVDDLVVIAGSPSLNVVTGMTLEAWVQPRAAQNGWRTIMQRETDAWYLNASNQNGPLFPAGGGTINDKGRFISGTSALALNTWTHVAITFDGTTLRLYVNGVQVSSGAFAGTLETNTNPLRIGGNVPYGEFFNGYIDEARVYNRALSAAEVTTDMNTPVQ